MKDLVEILAAFAHDAQWSGWMQYLFSKCAANPDGTMTIPAWAVQRWQRQMTTPYTELSESERESDREEARRVLFVLAQARDRGLSI